jgi:hypothetical protein
MNIFYFMIIDISDTVSEIFTFIYVTFKNNLFAMTLWLLYWMISELGRKIDLKNGYRYYEYDENFEKKARISFFGYEDNLYNKVFYRFKDEKSGLLIFLPKKLISFVDLIRLSLFLMYEYFFAFVNKNSGCTKDEKELPEWFVKKYILPLITERTYQSEKN